MKRKTKSKLGRLQKRFDSLALKQLRETASGLHVLLEQTQSELSSAHDSADFWHEQATNMQLAFDDEDFSTHRCVGLNKAGEMLVVNTDMKSS